MAIWITAYLQRVPPPLSPAVLQRGIADVDWWTCGEQFDLDEDVIDAFLARVRWRTDPLEFGVDGERPVQIHVWTDPAELRERIAELTSDDDRPLAPRVRDHLRACHAAVALELGFSQAETMPSIVAFELAYWLARDYHGLIHNADACWYDLDGSVTG